MTSAGTSPTAKGDASSDLLPQRPSEVFHWLGRFAPVFCLSGSQISILHEPSAYYDYLQTAARSFKRRAVLSALYLGTGEQEAELVNSLQKRCDHLRTSVSPFSVHVLLDFQRGSRGDKNSRTMLLPLMQSHKDQVKVSLFHTADLRGVWKTHMPERWNEIVGLLHMKVCVFDDDVLITGANLSDQYFTNRQDRYVLIKDCPHLANFFQILVDGISNASFHLQSDNQVKLSSDDAAHPFEGSKADFIQYAKDSVRHAYSVYPPTQKFAAGLKVSIDKADTWIYPLVQMKQFDVLKDEKATEEILSSVPAGTTIHLASGYFNLTRSYRQLILSQTQASYNILMASPRANGFFGAEGVSGNIPSMYVQIAKTFFMAIHGHAQQHRIKLFEYYRDKWTYHVKGLWATLHGEQYPSLTLVGSPNFGYRSVNRDIEAQIAIVTENSDLQKRLAEERDRLRFAGRT
ncbi:CDP-diacylglycerol--glycerol-3-phosphate 3-phosphatidyltransferase, mitochondrial [Hypsibius exemplaris]|uniref:CDP-diacylglycerol--glycerol-3-phosphate 3-phosphatidyltransferase n=1 Tax=Hypsibius exemplaris TaxID=2072580 RepID=A0A1W0WVU1_HYPEX|nr:CDP-diacylglycerol--glycerol-3-phosphate 3-phosphatidyltransferase, mitochondrial [Hypsibius exemplaris]